MILYQSGNTIATGRLSRDADFRIAGAKQSHFCSFSIPAAENEDGTTTWVNVDAAFDMADAAKDLKKGDHVLVCGKMVTRTYTAGGEEKRRTELKADFLLPMKQGSALADLANTFPGAVNVVDRAKPVFADEMDDGELPWEDVKSGQSVSGNGGAAAGYGVRYDA